LPTTAIINNAKIAPPYEKNNNINLKSKLLYIFVKNIPEPRVASK
jgi:hypothetical protein